LFFEELRRKIMARKFQLILCSAFLLTGFIAPVTNIFAATTSGREKPEIPRDLLYQRVEVADEDNAVVEWRRATKVHVPLGEHEKTAITYAWMPDAKEPDVENQNRLESWLRRNKEALDIFDASLHKPKTQWLELNSPTAEHPELSGFVLLIRARLLQAAESTKAGEFGKASDSLIGSLHLTQRAVVADGTLIHYVIECRARSLVEGGILRFAGHADVQPQFLIKLLDELPSLNDETNSYARTLRVEFTDAVYPGIDLQRVIEKWSKVSETNLAMMIFPEEFRRPFKILIDPELVSRHPMPLDENAEIEKAIRSFRINRDNTMSSWDSRNLDAETDHFKNSAKLLEDVKPLMEVLKDDHLPLTKQAAEKALPSYLQITNPVGRIFDADDAGFIVGDSRIFEVRTEREATRAELAVRIYERAKGHLPESLKELVKEKILDAVPLDPFSDKPLHYSRSKRIIWSVGLDGTDDGGDGDTDHKWVGKDAVWKISELN
jgi:hypothetical protein